jgi:beta-glucosidase
MRRTLLLGASAGLLALAGPMTGQAASPETAPAGATPPSAGSAPWMNPSLSPDRRAELVLDRMSLDDQISLLHGQFPAIMTPLPQGLQKSAGYVPGLPQYGIPAIYESDASLGVANASRDNDDATALPSGLAIASTFSPELAYEGGAMIGKEARQKGFNVMLAGGVNLARDPRNGRNFEYLGEDPLLAGTLDGASIRGIQSQHVVSTAKHYALNDQETGRGVLSAEISEPAMRESDLLAFQLALETGNPGSVMCSYNRINGVYACEHPELLTGVLRRDWKWPGWTMSDWGAVHSLDSAVAGLDQESAGLLDDGKVYFDVPLKTAVQNGKIPAARVREMAHRILRSMFAVGLVDHPLQPGGLDTAADAEVSGRAAEQGIVLLKNEGGVLPLARGATSIAVIGSHADIGVMSGGGSSQVIPKGSIRFPKPKGGPEWGTGVIYHPSAPLAAIQARGADAAFADGSDPAAAAELARRSKVAIVFVHQWATEAMDISMDLPDDQDALVEAVAAANPNTIVVLETGGPVFMPWLGKVKGVLEAWYPGSKGGEAIAKVLFGEVDASGRLPITFPASLDQLPRPKLPGAEVAVPEGSGPGKTPPFDVVYTEGSDVGYRWFAKTGQRPVFPFGHGLSYTQFRYSGLEAKGGRDLTVSFTVSNTGKRAGIDTPQVYLTRGPDRTQQRLIGWKRVELKPGESQRVSIKADPRLLANWDEKAHGWRLGGGAYQLFVGPDAASPTLNGQAVLEAATLKP